VRFAIASNWLKPPMKFIDRIRGVTQHFVDKSFNYKNYKNNTKQKRKIRKTQK